jgi:hypothetical protein
MRQRAVLPMKQQPLFQRLMSVRVCIHDLTIFSSIHDVNIFTWLDHLYSASQNPLTLTTKRYEKDYLLVGRIPLLYFRCDSVLSFLKQGTTRCSLSTSLALTRGNKIEILIACTVKQLYHGAWKVKYEVALLFQDAIGRSTWASLSESSDYTLAAWAEVSSLVASTANEGGHRHNSMDSADSR